MAQRIDKEANHDLSKSPKKRERKKATTTEKPEEYAVSRVLSARSANHAEDEDKDRVVDEDQGGSVGHLEDPIAAAVEEDPEKSEKDDTVGETITSYAVTEDGEEDAVSIVTKLLRTVESQARPCPCLEVVYWEAGPGPVQISQGKRGPPDQG